MFSSQRSLHVFATVLVLITSLCACDRGKAPAELTAQITPRHEAPTEAAAEVQSEDVAPKHSGEMAAQQKDEASAPIADYIRKKLQRRNSGAKETSPQWDRDIARTVAAFYEQRDYAPAWTDHDQRGQLIASLRDLRLDGLDPEEYGVARLEQANNEPPATTDSEGQADLDLAATHAYLLALTHLHRGKLDMKLRPQVTALIPHGQKPLKEADSPLDVRAAIEAVDQQQIKSAFAQARPRHPAYQAMREGLKRLIAQAEQGDWPTLPDGPAMHPGSNGQRVQILRRRLAAAGYLPADVLDSEQYDDALAAAVKQFQTDQLLKADGIVTAETRAALNVPVVARIDQMRVNLERARWQLQGLDGDFVLVDLAGYEVRYYRDGKPVWVSRVQVGLPKTPTPTLRSEISHITFNPMWVVPLGMMTRDVLPKTDHSLGYLHRNHLRVLDEKGREMNPKHIDWDEPEAAALMVQQDAGPWSALGRSAIRFQNPYGVYLHETPHKDLFVKDRRAFSNGCIRVERIMELVQALLGWDQAKIDETLADGKTHEIDLSRPIPILLVYWTVDAHEDGRVAYRPDVYALDPPTLKALNGIGL